MAKVVRMEEKAILTMAEKKILEKAHDILDSIYNECQQGGDLEQYARDAKEELAFFLDEGKDNFYEIEDDDNADIVKLIIEL